MDAQFLQRAQDIVEKYMSDEEFSVEMFADEMRLTRQHLNRKLRALTDCSTQEFIRTTRLQRAAQLLEKKSDTISQIAYAVGFNSLSYFTECFRKQFGQSPSEFAANR
jgi:AraC-like DNA-binding protein